MGLRRTLYLGFHRGTSIKTWSLGFTEALKHKSPVKHNILVLIKMISVRFLNVIGSVSYYLS